MDRANPPRPNEPTPPDPKTANPGRDTEPQGDGDSNPPRTTTGKITAPKFGSAGSGGAELEPGPPRP